MSKTKTKTKICAFGSALLLLLSLFPTSKLVLASDDFVYPVNPWKIYAYGGEFGDDRGDDKFHLGDDIPKPAGTNIYAFAEGVVRHIGIHSRFGTVVLVEHELETHERVVSLYGHLRSRDIAVREGQTVRKGQPVGRLGARGAENGYWGEHLHFGLRRGSYQSTWVYWGLGCKTELAKWYDPSEFLKKNIKTKKVEDKINTNSEPSADSKIITGPGASGRPWVRAAKLSGEISEDADFLAYQRKDQGGADVAVADLDLDQKDELVVGSGPSEEPYVRVFDQTTHQEKASFLAFSVVFKGGVRVAAGDLNGDGYKEIIAGAGPGGGAHVRVFDRFGNIIQGKLFPFGNKEKSGVDVAAGDLNGDKKDELIVSSGPGVKAQIRYYLSDFTLAPTVISPFPSGFKGGSHVTTGDIDKDGLKEIIIGAGPGGAPEVVAYEADGTARGIKLQPFPSDFGGGVDVAAADFDNDQKDEIITSQFSAGQAWVKVYRYHAAKTILSEFIAYNLSFKGGTNVAGRR